MSNVSTGDGVELVRAVRGVPLAALLPEGCEIDALGTVRDNLRAVEAALAAAGRSISDRGELLRTLYCNLRELARRGIRANPPPFEEPVTMDGVRRALAAARAWLYEIAPTATVRALQTSEGGVPAAVEKVEPMPTWDALGDAKRAILIVLARATDRLQGSEIARLAGYKPGTLRHHFGDLQRWSYIERGRGGYAITPAGRACIPCELV